MNIPIQKRAPRGTVNVLQEHIDEGIRKSSTHCAIAEAVRLAFPQATEVFVDLQTIRWSDRARGFRYTYLTPPIAQQYLLHFDAGVKCRPFSFNLRGATTSSVRVIVRRGDGKKTEKLRHRLGRKRLLPPDAGSPSEVYGGGKPPPKWHAL